MKGRILLLTTGGVTTPYSSLKPLIKAYPKLVSRQILYAIKTHGKYERDGITIERKSINP